MKKMIFKPKEYAIFSNVDSENAYIVSNENADKIVELLREFGENIPNNNLIDVLQTKKKAINYEEFFYGHEDQIEANVLEKMMVGFTSIR